MRYILRYGTSLVGQSFDCGPIDPLISYFFWQREPISITRAQLFTSALFAAPFAVVEGIVVVYLRAVPEQRQVTVPLSPGSAVLRSSQSSDGA